MDISGVSQKPPPPPPPSGSESLSEEEESLLEELLAEYDLENLSETDLENLASDIQEAGLEEGRALGDALRDAGLGQEELGQLASNSNNAPPPPPPQQEAGQGEFSINQELLTALSDLSESLNALNSSEDDVLSALQGLLEDNGIPSKGYIIDGVA